MIQLTYPYALAALAAIPLLLVLHFLRPRRRRVLVSSLSLWQAVLADRPAARGLRKLLRNLSLLLLLLIALALALALTGPQWIASTMQPSDVVLVLDVSASMKTRSGMGTTRFDQALAEARSILQTLPRNGRILVMTSGQKPVLQSGFEADHATLSRILSGLQPTDEAGRPREALALALTLLRGRSHGRVYFVSDGAFEPGVDPGSPQVSFRIVGGPARNVAITRFDVRQEPAGEERFQVLLTVRNYTDASVVVPASARLDDTVLFERRLELQPRAEETVLVTVPGHAVGQAVARIEVDDDLAADNNAYAALSGLPGLRVLLLSAGNVFLQSVLEALPGSETLRRELRTDDDLAQLARTYDVIVFDGIAAPTLPPGRYLLVDTVAPGLPFVESGIVQQPAIAGHGPSALVRDVDMSAVRIAQAHRVIVRAPGPGLQRLFWSNETDLGLALLDQGVKLVYLGFDLARSDFPLQAAFPLFISQSIEWLRPRGIEGGATQISAGSSHVIHVPISQDAIEVRSPSGEMRTLQAKDGSARFDATGRAGLYQYTVGDSVRHFAVNLTDARESDVNNRRAPPDRGAEAQDAARDAQTGLALWPHLLLAVLILLALEWFVWRGSRAHD